MRCNCCTWCPLISRGTDSGMQSSCTGFICSVHWEFWTAELVIIFPQSLSLWSECPFVWSDQRGGRHFTLLQETTLHCCEKIKRSAVFQKLAGKKTNSILFACLCPRWSKMQISYFNTTLEQNLNMFISPYFCPQDITPTLTKNKKRHVHSAFPTENFNSPSCSHHSKFTPKSCEQCEQVSLVNAKAERPNHPSCGGGVASQGGGQPARGILHANTHMTP